MKTVHYGFSPVEDGSFFVMNLYLITCKMREIILKSIAEAGSGHPGSSLSCTDIIAVLYFDIMNFGLNNFSDPGRDRFVLSKGHAAPALYAALALKGFFKPEEVLSLRQVYSSFQGHPSMKHTKGVEMSTGSLGQGVSAACGMALAARLDGSDYFVFSLLGDGEIQEGQVWEALMFAAHYKLSNLCVIIDNNGLQIDGKVCDVMDLVSIEGKLSQFGFNVFSVDGHDIPALKEVLQNIRHGTHEGPCAVIASTVKGKGVSFMENNPDWHGKAPSQEELAVALSEIKDKVSSLNPEVCC